MPHVLCMFPLKAIQRTNLATPPIRSNDPEWTPWLEFFLTALQRQMQRLKTRVEREKLMMGTLPEIAAQLIELTREQGRLTMADAVTLSGVNRNTLKQHFRTLVQDGHLTLRGRARGAWYSIA